jgi:hypothetical protein
VAEAAFSWEETPDGVITNAPNGADADKMSAAQTPRGVIRNAAGGADACDSRIGCPRHDADRRSATRMPHHPNSPSFPDSGASAEGPAGAGQLCEKKANSCRAPGTTSRVGHRGYEDSGGERSRGNKPNPGEVASRHGCGLTDDRGGQAGR